MPIKTSCPSKDLTRPRIKYQVTGNGRKSRFVVLWIPQAPTADTRTGTVPDQKLLARLIQDNSHVFSACWCACAGEPKDHVLRLDQNRNSISSFMNPVNGHHKRYSVIVYVGTTGRLLSPDLDGFKPPFPTPEWRKSSETTQDQPIPMHHAQPLTEVD